MSQDLSHLIDAIDACLPRAGRPHHVHEPRLRGNASEYVKECVDTSCVSYANGRFVEAFEKQLAEFTGTGYAIATVNGTAALHVCLMLAGVKPGDEVLVPALTFVATANAVRYCGAFPHFVDSEPETLGMDPRRIEQYLATTVEKRSGAAFNRLTGRRISVVVPMHVFGHPIDVDRLQEVCDQFHLVMVEDAAQSLGSYYKARHTGSRGLLSSLSFNGNKILTTGGGGAVLTSDASIAAQARHLVTTARVPHPWSFVHDEVGYNYRLPNLNAALGVAQMEYFPEELARKRRLAERYETALKGIPSVRFLKEKDGSRSNYWLNTILLEKPGQRNALLEGLQERGILARACWTLMHRLAMFKDMPRMPLPIAEDLEPRIVNLPSSGFLVS
jgi:perosamine synthetase